MKNWDGIDFKMRVSMRCSKYSEWALVLFSSVFVPILILGQSIQSCQIHEDAQFS